MDYQEITINHYAMVMPQDRAASNELNLLDVILNFASELRITPGAAFKTLAYPALQWIQISKPFYPEMCGDRFMRIEELESLKSAYAKSNYDFLETRFLLSLTDELECLFLSVSACDGERINFTNREMDLIKNHVGVYREHFEAWVIRKILKLPKFWFAYDPRHFIGGNHAIDDRPIIKSNINKRRIESLKQFISWLTLKAEQYNDRWPDRPIKFEPFNMRCDKAMLLSALKKWEIGEKKKKPNESDWQSINTIEKAL